MANTINEKNAYVLETLEALGKPISGTPEE